MASIKEVADRAGVSIKTISRYLNGYEGISQKTRAKVEEAMSALQFTPSAAAQSLRGRGDAVVGIITEGITTTPYAYEIIAGIQSVCDAQGCMLLISETDGSAKASLRAFNDFRRHRVSAILYATNYRKAISLPFGVSDTPCVLINCFESNVDRFPTVLPNDEQGAYLLTKALIGQGHRHIGFLTLSNNISATPLRNIGYQRAHVEEGLLVDKRYTQVGVIDQTDGRLIGGEFDALEERIHELLSLSPKPTAIMFGNDKMAMRAYMLVRGRLGYDIPGDLSLAGYDNYELIADNLVPGLTTVNLPYRDMGTQAAVLALRQYRTPERVLVDSLPIIRPSIAEPPKRGQSDQECPAT